MRTIWSLIKKAYDKLLRKKSSRVRWEQDADGTIHIYHNVLVHGFLSAKGALDRDSTLSQHGEK